MKKRIAICIFVIMLMVPAAVVAANDIDLSEEFLPSGPPAGTRDQPPEGTVPVQPAGTPAGEVVVIPTVPHNFLGIHTVQPNQTLSFIARAVYPELDHHINSVHNEAIDQIIRDNPIIRNRHVIQPGWQLRIYAFGSIPVPMLTPEEAAAARAFPHLPTTHRVVPNDNLTLIAIRYFPTLNLQNDIPLRLSVISHIARDNDIRGPNYVIHAGTNLIINPYLGAISIDVRG